MTQPPFYLPQLKQDSGWNRSIARPILLRGHFGQGNWGDELLLQALVDGLTQNHFPATRLHYWTGPNRSFESARIESSNPRSIGGALAWLKAGSMIFTGGIFYDHLFRFGVQRLRRLDRIVRLAWAMGKKVLFFGISIGPLTTEPGRRLTRAILSRAHGIWVRDAASAQFCRKAGIGCHEIPDISVILGPRISTIDSAMTQDLLFIPCAAELDPATHARAITALKPVAQNYGLELKLLPIDAPTDRPLARRISQECGVSMVVLDGDDPWQIMARIKAARLVVSGRLHGGWGAYLCGRPLIQIDCHPKCLGMARTIDLPSPCLIDRRCDAVDIRRAADLWLDSEKGDLPRRYSSHFLEAKALEAFHRLSILLRSDGTIS